MYEGRYQNASGGPHIFCVISKTKLLIGAWVDTLVLKFTYVVITKVNNFFEVNNMLAGKYSLLIEDRKSVV